MLLVLCIINTASPGLCVCHFVMQPNNLLMANWSATYNICTYFHLGIDLGRRYGIKGFVALLCGTPVCHTFERVVPWGTLFQNRISAIEWHTIVMWVPVWAQSNGDECIKLYPGQSIPHCEASYFITLSVSDVIFLYSLFWRPQHRSCTYQASSLNNVLHIATTYCTERHSSSALQRCHCN